MVVSSKIKLSVVIPAYNEEQRLPHTLEQVLAYLNKQAYKSEVIVVDDGSIDRTGRVVESQDPGSLPLKLLCHGDGANHGKGAAVNRGILAAQGRYRLFMDADNSTTLDQIERFWPSFDEGYDIAVGSRALKESVVSRHQSFIKELAGRTGNMFIRALAVPGIYDTQAGFKMFTAEAAENIFPKQTIDGWGYDIELLAIAGCMGYRICEIPINWRNAPGSKVTTGTYLDVFGEIWKIRRNLRAGLYE